MAPRKDKHTVNDELIECSAAATKRRRIEVVNGATGIPINTDLQLSPPATIYHQDQLDDILSSLMPQHNFLISYHMNQMVMSVKEFWRRTFVEEEIKRKEMKAKLKQKEEEVCRLRENYFRHEEEAFRLEEMLSGLGPPAPEEEEVESGFVDPDRRVDRACRNCRRRPAAMLWLPCRHVCVCLVCERRVKQCPICGLQKTESFIVSLS